MIKNRTRNALLLGMSCGALTLASPQSGNAANYVASNETELRAAIVAANADGDPASTITVTSNIAVADPTALPAVTKPGVTIDRGTFNVTINNNSLTNNGTITGSTALGSIETSNFTLLNNGAMRAFNGNGGTTIINNGSSDGILFRSGANVYELRAGGSMNPGATIRSFGTDTFRLGGSVDATLDVSQISSGTFPAPSRTYNNFEFFQKVGTSTWTLTGATAGTNTVTSWQILAGTLSVSSNTNLGAAAGTVTFDGGTLQNTASFSSARTMTVNAGGGTIQTLADLTLAGVIGGAGALAKSGSSRLILTGTNTYAGGTTISEGTLQLGNGGTTGSIAGDVVNSATLAFDRSNLLTFGGLISGGGAVNQIGPGTTVFTANNTYTGLTTISAGRLELGNGGTSGSIAGDVLNNSVLAFNRSNAFIMPGAISGSGAVEQNGGGTTVLTGDNTYSGGTMINAGTLQLGNGGTSGSIVGDVLNNSALAFNRSDTMTFGGIISGSGAVNQIGSGVTVLIGNNIYTGDTTVSAGTLLAGATNVFSPLSAHTVLSGGTLDLAGFNQTVASLDNAGLVNLSGAPGTTLTVTGGYAGSGGTINLNTALGGDSSVTDRLVVGGSTSGATNLKVTNVGGAGAPTVEGIKVVDVGGASNGTFALQGNYVLAGQQAVVGGAFAYTLQQNGVSTPADGDWYLRSSLINPLAAAPAGPLYQPGVPLYENYAQVLLGLNDLPTLQQRVGNRYWGGSDAMARAGTTPAPSVGSATPSAFWGRIEGRHADLQPTTTTGSTYKSDQMKVQVGLDGLALENSWGRMIVGLTAQYGLATANVASFFGNGRIRAEGTGVGATATWYGDNGFYVDGQAQTMFYRSNLSSVLAGSMTHGNEGFGYSFSVESGKRIGIGNGWSLTPQGQLAYSKVAFDQFADRFAAVVSLTNAESLLGRAGLSLNHQKMWNDGSGIVRSDVYAIANLHYEFLNGSIVNVAGTSFANANDRLWGSIGGGGVYSWANGRYSVFGEVTYNASLAETADNHSYKGTGGFRLVW
ncbi:autotransporter outer membrane beta-barrel domain-containing protein [Bradyrhizobium sp. 197]|uniref:autotransporter family protein n=1 Tax=Bradyrhizobium sp. 197 TaxID=2782663 RepID=UPI001FF94438|nr:autotransporter outer membrane beta-barrel domain-containing protein [Bradyrhizobium sp. 197]MCK1475963.1 autotransporter outer membrane beta-barrel domain-containing protein [Bradyrhizobium sp. 197]